MKILNKAAMFGLDARIALAIFGALSVISGAALYSAIKNARLTAIRTEINEVEKALEAYILDTGVDLEYLPTYHNITTGHLISNPGNVTNWNGPYLSYKIKTGSETNRAWLQHDKYDEIGFRKFAEDWNGDDTKGCSTAPCHYWIQLDLQDAQLAKDMDIYIDGTDSPLAGKAIIPTSNSNVIVVKSIRFLKQP